jgi:hypothetical protein
MMLNFSKIIHAFWLLPIFACVLSASAAELRLDGDRIYLKAEREHLEGVLNEFVRAGVQVEVEPGIAALVNGTLFDEPIQEGLARLFDDFNYILFWKQIDGPLGPMPKLSEIHLFRPGRHRHVKPFVPTGDDFIVVRRAGIPPHAKDELLLGLKPGTTTKQFREMLASIGATAVDSISGLGIYQVRLPRNSDVPAVVEALKRNPWVALAEPNHIQEIANPVLPTDSTLGTAPGARAIGKPGEGIAALAILDSGLTEIEELGDTILGSYDAVNPERSIEDPVGHGTQMALVASGAVVPHGVPAGAASEAVPVLAVRSFDDEGRATNFSLIRGIDYAVQNGARVMSMSWGSETYSEFLAGSVQLAQDKGLIVVASAGNDPINRPVYPAAYPGVLAVSAMEPDGSIWSRSNYGSFIFAAAPAVGVFPVGYNGPPGTYAGTSIASPTVARALTLYFGENPDATPAEAIDALKSVLTDAGETGRDDYYGHGALDAAALQKLLGP